MRSSSRWSSFRSVVVASRRTRSRLAACLLVALAWGCSADETYTRPPLPQDAAGVDGDDAGALTDVLGDLGDGTDGGTSDVASTDGTDAADADVTDADVTDGADTDGSEADTVIGDADVTGTDGTDMDVSLGDADDGTGGDADGTDADVADVSDSGPMDVADTASDTDDADTEEDAGPQITVPEFSVTSLPNMIAARQNFSLSAIGGRLYVAGGRGLDNKPSDILQWYNNDLEEWFSGNQVPLARENAGTAVVAGQMYVVGGTGVGGAPLAPTVRYNPGQSLWKVLFENPEPGCCMAGVGIGDTVWMFGGRAGSTLVQSYDPAQGLWLEHEPMPLGRSRHAAVALGTSVVVMGGANFDNPIGKEIFKSVHVYDTLSDTWATGPEAPFARWDIAAAVWQGQIFVIGGADSAGLPSDEVWILELNKGWVKAGNLGVPRRGHRAVATAAGIYVLGGAPGDGLPYDSLELMTFP